MTGLGSTLQNWLKEGFTVVVATDQPNRARAVLEQIGVNAVEATEHPGALAPPPDPLPATRAIRGEGENPTVHLTKGNLGGGFVVPAWKFALVTDAELFGVARLKID